MVEKSVEVSVSKIYDSQNDNKDQTDSIYIQKPPEVPFEELDSGFQIAQNTSSKSNENKSWLSGLGFTHIFSNSDKSKDSGGNNSGNLGVNTSILSDSIRAV